MAELLAQRGNALIVTGLGSPTWDCFAAGDSPEYLYSWGGMGLAVPTALGIALAQPDRRVIGITGDGEIMMGHRLARPWSAIRRRRTSPILVLDNEKFGETGRQRGLTASRTDIAAVAKGFGIRQTMTVTEQGAVGGAGRASCSRRRARCSAVAKIAITEDPWALPEKDGATIAHRFRAALGLEKACERGRHSPPRSRSPAAMPDPSVPRGEREVRIRTAVVTYFPMFIAALSLLTSVYNGYLNSKFVDIIQRNVGRTEYMRTCKEIIDAYFQVKFRAGIIATGGSAAPSAQIDGGNAVAKFAALGTYLANLRDDAIRQRYSELSGQLSKVVGEARNHPRPAGQGVRTSRSHLLRSERRLHKIGQSRTLVRRHREGHQTEHQRGLAARPTALGKA